MHEIKQNLLKELESATSEAEIEAVRVRFLGRKGIITRLMRDTDFSTLNPEARRDFGRKVNEQKAFAAEAIETKLKRIRERALAKPALRYDLLVPGYQSHLGSMHPITLVQLQLEGIFRGMGFRVMTGFEVEKEYYNFDALNIPQDHPAREMHDTYWLTNGDLLRTHTSATQVRALQKHGAPLRAIFPGRCFRYEAVDASHENTFYQLEGVVVDRDISVAHLIGVMKSLLEQVFERRIDVRLRPGFFPFVEPGFELDFQCTLCSGKGCPTCKGTGWIELIPCGLIHPRVLEAGGISPTEFSGFAFGCGLTRLAMMKFRIPYIRLFNSGDIRFLEQFPVII